MSKKKKQIGKIERLIILCYFKPVTGSSKCMYLSTDSICYETCILSILHFFKNVFCISRKWVMSYLGQSLTPFSYIIPVSHVVDYTRHVRLNFCQISVPQLAAHQQTGT